MSNGDGREQALGLSREYLSGVFMRLAELTL